MDVFGCDLEEFQNPTWGIRLQYSHKKIDRYTIHISGFHDTWTIRAMSAIIQWHPCLGVASHNAQPIDGGREHLGHILIAIDAIAL